jgi:hypothetical protein
MVRKLAVVAGLAGAVTLLTVIVVLVGPRWAPWGALAWLLIIIAGGGVIGLLFWRGGRPGVSATRRAALSVALAGSWVGFWVAVMWTPDARPPLMLVLAERYFAQSAVALVCGTSTVLLLGRYRGRGA